MARTPFASRTVAEHLMRGLGGFAAAASGYLLVRAGLDAGFTAWSALGAIALGGVAVFLLRGCPTCWTIGLVDTLLHSLRSRKPTTL